MKCKTLYVSSRKCTENGAASSRCIERSHVNKWQVVPSSVTRASLHVDDVTRTFAGWRWRSISTSMPGSKGSAAMRWKVRWTRWLRMLVYHISGRILLRTCQVCLYVCMLTCLGSWCLIEIMQKWKFSLWCVRQVLRLPRSFPLGGNIICRLYFPLTMKLPCYAVPLAAHVHAAASMYTCTVPVCHRL